MAQATCVLWLAETRHVPVSNFPYCTGPDYGSSAILFTKEQRKKTFKSRKKFNEFSKLGTNVNNLKESFTIMKTRTTL